MEGSKENNSYYNWTYGIDEVPGIGGQPVSVRTHATNKLEMLGLGEGREREEEGERKRRRKKRGRGKKGKREGREREEGGKRKGRGRGEKGKREEREREKGGWEHDVNVFKRIQMAYFRLFLIDQEEDKARKEEAVPEDSETSKRKPIGIIKSSFNLI